MFDELFGGLFGSQERKTADIVGKVIEQEGKHYFIVDQAKHFVSVFLAVEVDGPESTDVIGKPVITLSHKETTEAYYEKLAAAKRREAQNKLVLDCASWYRNRREPGTQSEWAIPMPSTVAPKDLTCHVNCPARGRLITLSGGPIEHENFLDAFCDDHRPLVDAYLEVHPDAWPPKEEE